MRGSHKLGEAGKGGLPRGHGGGIGHMAPQLPVFGVIWGCLAVRNAKHDRQVRGQQPACSEARHAAALSFQIGAAKSTVLGSICSGEDAPALLS